MSANTGEHHHKLGIILFALVASVTGCADPGQPGYNVDGTTPGERGADPNGRPSSSTGASSGASSSSPVVVIELGKFRRPEIDQGRDLHEGTKSYGTMKKWECIPSSAPPKAGLVVALHGYRARRRARRERTGAIGLKTDIAMGGARGEAQVLRALPRQGHSGVGRGARRPLVRVLRHHRDRAERSRAVERRRRR